MLPFLRPPFAAKTLAQRQLFVQWLNGKEGNQLVAAEQEALNNILPGLVGCRALQIGLTARHDLLADCKHAWRWRLSTLDAEKANLRVDAAGLPIASQSMDLVVLHHSLDVDSNPYRIVAEATRILAVGGTLLIVGFNPFSLLGLQRWLRVRTAAPWSARFLRAGRVSDWAGVCGCRSLGYLSGHFNRPESRLGQWLRYFAWQRLGGFYVLIIRKQAYPLKPLQTRRHLLVDLPTNVIAVPAARWQRTRSSFETGNDI